MDTLFYVSSLNRPYIYNYLIQTNIEKECLFLTREPSIAQELKRIGITRVFIISIHEDRPTAERDKTFADEFMPGVFGSQTYTETDLPVYSVMSLDRLFFWRTPGVHRWIDFVRQIGFDELVVTLTLNDSYAWALVNYALDMNKTVWGIQGQFMLTEEWYYLLPHLDEMQLIVEENVVSMLDNHHYFTVENHKPQPVCEFNDHERTRVGIVYDRRYDHQFRMLLRRMGDERPLIFTLDERSEQLLPNCVPGAVSENISLVNICKEIALPCPYDLDFGTNTVYYDLFGVWRRLFPERTLMLNE